MLLSAAGGKGRSLFLWLDLAMVLEGGYECVYSDAGYKVGMADALIRVLKGNSDT